MIGQQSCRCCGEGGLTPRIQAAARAIESQMATTLHLNSGYRCIAHNANVGGSKNSAHKLGKAMDVWTPDYKMSDLYWVAVEMPIFFHGEIGLYWTDKGYFIHLAEIGYKKRFAYSYGKRMDFDEALKKMEAEALKY